MGSLLFVCHGLSLSGPSDSVTTNQLYAHERRTHTYKTLQPVPVELLLDQMDTNGNGQIDALEWRNYLVGQGRYTDAVAKSIFERLDT
jgi:hypothetical protein